MLRVLRLGLLALALLFRLLLSRIALKRLPLLAFGLAVRSWAPLTILLGVALIGLMMSPFPPNLAKCYRLVLGGRWLARLSTVCLSNLGLFMSKLLFGRMFIQIDVCLSLPWLSLGLFGVVSGGIWAFFPFMPPCWLVAWFLPCRLVAGLFVSFPNRLLLACLAFVPWLAAGLLVSFSSPLLGGFPWLFSLQGPLGSCWLSWLLSLGPLFPVARLWWCGACPAPSSCAVR